MFPGTLVYGIPGLFSQALVLVFDIPGGDVSIMTYDKRSLALQCARGACNRWCVGEAHASGSLESRGASAHGEVCAGKGDKDVDNSVTVPPDQVVHEFGVAGTL